MNTAVLSATATGPLAGGGSAATESAVDAYATRVLEASTPSDSFFDTSLGPYVASVLRGAEMEGGDVTSMGEFDSLLELLEDQCNMEREKATTALQSIAKAVVTGIVPSQDSSFSIISPLGGLYSKSNLDSFQSSKLDTADHNLGFEQKLEQLSIDPYTPSSAGGPSPLKPDNLIPVDLLGFLDDPSPHQQHQKHPYARNHALGMIPAAQAPAPVEEQKTANNEEAFPPLGAAATPSPANPSSANGQKASLPKKGGKGKGKSKARNSDKELAAALFRPSRPRQNSIDKEESSPVLTPATPQTSTQTPQHLYATDPYFQQQVDSCVEILLSMNGEIGEAAATEAALMANADFNVAQYVIDRALTAPPVCRHMLHDGCYRSDCQFSHDVEGHTCLFWLRGRCTKPVSVCKFLHGFHSRHMEGITPSNNGNGHMHRMVPPNMGYGYPPATPGFGGFSLTSPTAVNGNMVSPAQVSSSWQPTPSLAESSASNSYASSVGSSNGGSGTSFANIASRGYDKAPFTAPASMQSPSLETSASASGNIPTVRIPQDLWNVHENRDASAFYIADPMERYRQVSLANGSQRRDDVIDLHFQSTKTFAVVLESVLPSKLSSNPEGVWVVTGTGHHVGSKTHQKGGGALERAVLQWLQEQGYSLARGKDRNGLGGALLVKR